MPSTRCGRGFDGSQSFGFILQNDQGASYWRYAVLQWWSRLKISFCEIFCVLQFPTFATLSATGGHRTLTEAQVPSRRVLRTMSAYIPQPLSPEQSGRTWKLAGVLAKATSIFDSMQEAEQWLERPAIGLNRMRPAKAPGSPFFDCSRGQSTPPISLSPNRGKVGPLAQRAPLATAELFAFLQVCCCPIDPRWEASISAAAILVTLKR
ncbi:hypothetical protein ABIF97_000497 [Bradyrhizobium japonicum]|jgi:hypothetical protein